MVGLLMLSVQFHVIWHLLLPGTIFVIPFITQSVYQLFTHGTGCSRIFRSEARKVFVGGLASEVTEKDFHDYFAQFGTVKDAVVMVDRATNRSRYFKFSYLVFCQNLLMCFYIG